MKRFNWLLAAAAVALVLCASIAPAWSYFTAYSEANGTLSIKITPETTIREEYSGHVKTVAVYNLKESDTPVYIRARAYLPESVFEIEYPYSEGNKVSGEHWSEPDENGWSYFSLIVKPGERTEDLNFNIVFPSKDYKPEEGENYSVIVLYESTPVKYRTDGTPYADWNLTKNHKTEGGVVFDD